MTSEMVTVLQELKQEFPEQIPKAPTGERQVQRTSKTLTAEIEHVSSCFFANCWCPTDLRGPTPTKFLFYHKVSVCPPQS